MAQILEEIKGRLLEAQKQLSEAQQALAVATNRHQSAQHQFNIWNAAMQIEQREEQLRQDAAKAKQPELPLTSRPDAAVAPVSVSTPVEQSEEQDGPNKTDIVRNLLRQHPAGMSAVDIWKTVGAQFNHRPYLYSVLKRLRDRNEISKKRNKYFLTAIAKSEEAREQQVIH